MLEYASADAVKRSGLHRDEDGKATAEKYVNGLKKSGGRRRPGKQTRISMREEKSGGVGAAKDQAMDVDDADDEVDNTTSAQTYGQHRPQKPLPGKKAASNPRYRAKPGAALAQAQREKVAIVPSQGTRLVFS